LAQFEVWHVSTTKFSSFNQKLNIFFFISGNHCRRRSGRYWV